MPRSNPGGGGKAQGRRKPASFFAGAKTKGGGKVAPKPAPKRVVVRPLRTDVGRSVPKRPKLRQLDRENRRGLREVDNPKPVFVPKRLPK